MIEDSPGYRLRQLREAAGTTRAQFAAKLGVSQSTVRAHENGQNGIQPGAAQQYARELGTSAAWILYGVEEKGRTPEVSVARIPVVGHLRTGYHPENFRQARERYIEPKELSLSLPGFENDKLSAYIEERDPWDGRVHYAICAAWSGRPLTVVDEIVVRSLKGDLTEIDAWKVGGDEGGAVFYKGPSQSKAHELLKLRKSALGRVELEKGVWILGVIVGRLEYLRGTRESITLDPDTMRA